MKTLCTPNDVIKELGGTSAVAVLTRRKASSVSTWKARGKFPADTFIILTHALKSKKATAPVSLWGMTNQEAA